MRSMAGRTSMRLHLHEPLEQREAHLLALLGVELHPEQVAVGERGAVRDAVLREERGAARLRRRGEGVGEVDVLTVERTEERVTARGGPHRAPADVRQLHRVGQLRDLALDEAEAALAA